MKKILVVDDDAGARESLRTLFQIEYQVMLTSSALEALDTLASTEVDLVLLDVVMPKKDGVTLLKELVELYPDLPVIMISASSDARHIVESIKSGAIDFVTKPFDVRELKQLVWRTLENRKLMRKIKAMESDLSRHYPKDSLLGYSDLFEKAIEAAKEAAKNDIPILIHGEEGTGKEMVARQIHAWSERSDDPFVGVYCAAIPNTLIESEMFGHDKSAFSATGEVKPGRVDLAASGSLFFDDIGEIPIMTQNKILRLLEKGYYLRLGGSRMRLSSARIIATTNCDLTEKFEQGTFLKELYFKLNVFPIYLPPLRERREDIPVLAEHFLEMFKRSMQFATKEITPEALKALCVYDWPGNIRELKNVIERSLVLHGDHEKLDLDLLPNEFHGEQGRSSKTKLTLEENLSSSVDLIERQLLIDALRTCGGIQTKAAEALGTTRRILKYKMDKLHITLPLDDPE